MSHLISTYAKTTGLRIARPDVLSTFIATPYTRFITVQTGSGQAAKNYDYWQEVIAMIGPILGARQIGVIHLGGKDDPQLQGVHDMRGKTTIQQAQYLISNSMLHMGNDSWLAHCAGWSGTPLVALYGSTSAQNHGPYWCDKAKTRLISSHRAGGVPSYSSQETPKTVNMIPVEEVANAVMSLLALPDAPPAFTQQSRLFGLLYTHALFDVVPNSFPSHDWLPGAAVTVRMDYLFREDVLDQLLRTGRKVNIVTKRPIDLGLLNHFKASILSYTHEIDDQCPQSYVAALPTLIKHHTFYTKERDAAKVAALRMRFFDLCTVQQSNDVSREDYITSALAYLNWAPEKRSVLEEEITSGRLRFKSNRYILSDGKMYLSTAHLRLDQPTDSFANNGAAAIDDPDWYRDLNHFAIFHQPAL